MWRQVRIPPPQPCKWQQTMKKRPIAWGYNSVTLLLGGDKYKHLVLQVVTGCRANNLLCKQIISVKSKKVKIGWSHSRTIRQNLPRKAIGLKVLFCEWWWRVWYIPSLLPKNVISELT
jgi:hypothetical protein